MRIIPEHKNESLDRICHVYPMQDAEATTPADEFLVAIDEDFLAWLYLAPGYEESEKSRQVIDLARQLIGADAWAVVQVEATGEEALLEQMGLHVIESYENAAPAPRGVTLHLTRTL